jgi:predicted nucleic acid-binding protein
MTAACFVDANVLIYSVDRASPQKRTRALEWLEVLWRASSGRIGIQVLNEFYVIATAKLPEPVAPKAARAVMQQYLAWRPVPVDGRLIGEAWAIEDRYRLSWWDCLIVAAAKRAECAFLLTEDLQHLQDYGGLVAVNPFRAAAEDVLSR